MNPAVALPNLRFKEFQADEPWPLVGGSKLFGPIDRRPAQPGLPVLAITQDQGAVARDQINYHVSVTDASIESYKEVRPGDFIISLRSFQGGIEYSQVSGICSPAYVLLGRLGAGNDDFYRHLFKSPRFIQQLTRTIEGIRDGKMISFKQFSEQLLPEPSLAEQTKVAECLNSLDELIAAENQKLDALRKHKKGLLQQLFPRPERTENGKTLPAETTPRLRFPEFLPTGKWEAKPLRKVCGINPPANGLPESFIYIDLESVVDGNLIKRNRIPLEGAPSRAQRLLYSGDVIFQIVRPYQRNNLFVAFDDTDPYVASTGYAQLRANGSKPFLFQAIHHDAFVDKVVAKCTGSNYPAINSSDLAEIQLSMPPMEAEQERIASCLGSLDSLITAQAKKVDILKTHKQGLMQGLFPTVEGR